MIDTKKILDSLAYLGEQDFKGNTKIQKIIDNKLKPLIANYELAFTNKVFFKRIKGGYKFLKLDGLKIDNQHSFSSPQIFVSGTIFFKHKESWGDESELEYSVKRIENKYLCTVQEFNEQWTKIIFDGVDELIDTAPMKQAIDAYNTIRQEINDLKV